MPPRAPCYHNSAEKPIENLIVEIGFTGERLFITEYFRMGKSLELHSCKNGHHGHQRLGSKQSKFFWSEFNIH
jgi:hypothetical protein